MSDDFGAHILSRLISKMPAQQILVYLALARGLSPAEVLRRFADMPLREILNDLEKDLSGDRWVGADSLGYPGWFKNLHEQMESTCDESSGQGPRRRFVPFFPRSNGRIHLEEFLKSRVDPAGTLEKWAQQVETIVLIAKVLAGIPAAVEQLIAHERWVRGYVAARVENRPESDRVLNHAWNRIYKKLHTFDPTTTSFRRFALIWVPYAIGSPVGSASRFPVVTDALQGCSSLDGSVTDSSGDKGSIIEAHLPGTHWSREILGDYLVQQLAEEQQIEIEEHLASCEICVSEARRLHSPNDLWQKTGTG